MSEADKPSVQGLMGLVDSYGSAVANCCNDQFHTPEDSRDAERNEAEAEAAVRAYAERLASAAAPAAQPATPLREVLSDERTAFDYLLNAMENAGHAHNPHQEGYGDKRRAVLAYVHSLERRAALLAASSDEDRKLMHMALDALEESQPNEGRAEWSESAIAALRSRLDGEKG